MISWQSTAGHISVTLQSSSWIGWQSTADHTSVTLHSSPVDQLAEHSWSHFCDNPFITRGSAGRLQLVTLLLLFTHHPWISWQSTVGHCSVTLHSSPVDQLAEYSWSHFCYSSLITRGSDGRPQLVTLLLLSSHRPCVSWQNTLVTLRLLSTHHPCVSWQNTAGHTSVILQSSPVDQLAKHSWSHFCYSPLITRGSAGRSKLVTLLLLPSHHPCGSWQSTLVTLRLLSTQYLCVSWQSTAGHSSVTLHSAPVDQLAKTTGGHTSVTLHSSPVDQLPEYSWSHFGYSLLITRGSAGRAQLVTLLLISTHNPWISWQSTSGHTSITLHSSPMGQLAEHSWSHCC